jgi:hypothetical protein
MLFFAIFCNDLQSRIFQVKHQKGLDFTTKRPVIAECGSILRDHEVAGSNPVAPTQPKSSAERKLSVPSGGQKCGLEAG